MIPVPGNTSGVTGKTYLPDLMIDKALDFINANKANSFFLYFSSPIPHVPLQVPDEELEAYTHLPDTPYVGDKGYFKHPKPHAAYAAMITRLDRHIGQLVQALKDNNLYDNTLIIFTSDNGPTFNGGSDSKFFNSASGMRGLKCSLLEGGIRVPFIAHLPRLIAAHSKTEQVAASWDMLPTFADIFGFRPQKPYDGISILPTLGGLPHLQVKHPPLYWEDNVTGEQAVRLDNWKGFRTNLRQDRCAPIQLYNLAVDPNERNNVSAEHRDVVQQIARIMREQSTPNQAFPFNPGVPR